jgi:predicted RNA-binding protein with PIN domain
VTEWADRVVVVDGANVVGSRPDGWWRDRAGAAQRLVASLRAVPVGGEVQVVLEGGARAGVPAGTYDQVTVVHADGSGDDAIVDVVAEVRGRTPAPEVTVVTSDRELRRRVQELGATAHGPRWLSR